MTVPSPQAIPSGDLEHGFPAPPGRMLARDLTGLDERELLGFVGSLPKGSELRAAACEQLVSRYKWLVRSCVRPYL
jgi:hypothetical protein